MKRRLLLFGFGIAIGSALAYSMLFKDNHDVGKWLPGNRVLEEISDSTVYSSVALCQMSCLLIDKESITKVLADGDVNFGESNPKTTPKIYQVEGTSLSGKAIVFRVKMLPRKAEIFSLKVIDSAIKCDCE